MRWDTDTEAQIMNSVYELHGDKTLLVIAHRLSTIEKADLVVRMSEGTVTQTEIAKADN